MKCPQCIKEDKKSVVTVGNTFTNAGPYFPVQYDEDGKMMTRPQPKSTTQYSCSNGHYWKETK